MRSGPRTILALLFLLAACQEPAAQSAFPAPDREVAPIVADRFSTEDARDRSGEAESVMRLSGVRDGMSVADIGAGEGYYTVRLAPLVGARGRVLAEDIVPATVNRLGQRVQQQRLDNVAVKLGAPDDPKLPPRSFDLIFLVHMYHEVEQPYALLWHVREGLRDGGRIVVVDSDRPIRHHGTPPPLLRCELAAVGLEEIRFERLADDNYLAMFVATRPRPQPGAIRPCLAAPADD